jgi:hypothetical protein
VNDVSTCELKIIIKAEEPALRQICALLTQASPGQPPLTEVVVTTVKETLLAAGVTTDFEVELYMKGINPQRNEGLGLNAWEWLRHETLAHHVEMGDPND